MPGDSDGKLKGARSGELGWSPNLKKGLAIPRTDRLPFRVFRVRAEL